MTEKLKSFVERIERLEIEKSDLSQDIKEIYQEIKSFGLCSKTVKKLVSLRKIDNQKRQEEQELLKLYARAIQLDLFV